MNMQKLVDYIWYRNAWMGYLFWPLSLLFRLAADYRKQKLLEHQETGHDIPVIVIGNITVGGTGKTPLLMAVVDHLKSTGLKPGVVSRGYGGSTTYPCKLSDANTISEVGDEPMMIFRNCHCPVVVDPDRKSAVTFMIENCDVDIIVSDDGLQHYAMARDLEIAVIDGARGLGNGLCLPAGPLREPASRLESVDICVVNGEHSLALENFYSMQLETAPLEAVNQATAVHNPPEQGPVHGVAGIGNPARFFDTLAMLGFFPYRHVFPDHHHFLEQELLFEDKLDVVMTEKDAIKCRHFEVLDRHWYLPVKAKLDNAFWVELDQKVTSLMHKKN